MTEFRYSFRPSAFGRRRTFRLDGDALHLDVGGKKRKIKYRDVRSVRLYKRTMPRQAAVRHRVTVWCAVYSPRGVEAQISPLHSAGFGRWDDRSAAYAPFVRALLAALRRENPDLKIVSDVHWTLALRRSLARALGWCAGMIAGNIADFLGNRDLDNVAGAAGWTMQVLGPWLRGHRVAMANLKLAFPEKSDRERRDIVRDVWNNFGRVLAEYALFEKLWDYDPADRERPDKSRIIVDEATRLKLKSLAAAKKPVLYFGAHIANWELPPRLSAAHGIHFTGIYRPSNSSKLDDFLIRVRSRSIDLIPALSGAAMRMRSALRRGSSLAMLLDQHFVGGVEVVFFGRRCRVNPTLARIARHFEYPIHGARAIRLPGERFRLEVTDRLEPPRDGDGRIDVAATMQMITWVIETWVREHPEQWLWMHRRWR